MCCFPNFSLQDKQVHHVSVNLLQMESEIEYANTTPLVCQCDLLACLESDPSDVPKVGIRPTPFSKEV